MPDPELVLQVLRGTCIVLYGLMMPVAVFSVWLEYRHPEKFNKLPEWLK